MSFEDFQKNWKVTTKESTECPEGSSVIISGTGDLVEITCKVGETSKNTYPPGRYNKDTNRIEEIREDGTDGYQIGFRMITFTPGKTPRTGSWTAEDQGPWPGDG